MHRFLDLPIRHKLTLIGLATTTVALLLACSGFIAYELFAFRKDLARDVASTAAMVGYNSASAVSFDDASSAERTLQALDTKPNIVAACIYGADGHVFAAYPRGRAAADFPPPSAGATERFHSTHLDLFRPITVEGEIVGTIYLRSDLTELRERLVRYAMIAGIVMLFAILVAYALGARLQRLISAPVADLAAVASRVALEKDYSVRAVKRGHDELGRLIDGFNDMLAQIQARDASLQATHATLEHRVEERTRSLQRAQAAAELAQARFKFIFDSLPVGVTWMLSDDLDSRIANPAYAHVTGVPAEHTRELERYRQATHPDDRVRQDELHRRVANGENDRYTIEKRYILPDGQIRWAELTVRFYRNSLDGRTQEIGTLVDLTRIKEGETKLAYERDQLRALLDASPDTIYFKDLQSRFVQVSRSKVGKTVERVPDLTVRRAAKGLEPNVPEADLLTGLTDFDTLLESDARTAFDDEQRIILTGEPIAGKLEKQIYVDGSLRWNISSKMPWRDRDGKIVGTFGISKDITDLKQAEQKVEDMHRQLMDTSREAGMAEVATGVLHNVGNVLNSVNVSATLVADHIRHSKAGNVAKLAVLFAQHKTDLPGFLTNDTRGRMIPDYLGTLAESLADEQKGLVAELDNLRKNIEHIKEIVSMQQAYARTSGVIETISVPDMIEDALRINAGSLARHDVDAVRDYQARPVVTTDKHKVMQILINLVRNAKYACDESGRTDKLITVRTTADQRGVQIAIVDNGVGIPEENLTRIFNHGFTTRKTGHGFGLHSGALAARELGGSLTVHSEGPGHGATFTLVLPFRPGL